MKTLIYEGLTREMIDTLEESKPLRKQIILKLKTSILESTLIENVRRTGKFKKIIQIDDPLTFNVKGFLRRNSP